MAQSTPDFEVIAWDDASTDGSWEYLQELRDERFRLFRNEKNLGYGVGLNRGIEEARGNYIARMDADDVVHSERLERQMRVLDENPGVGIVGAGCRLIDATGQVTGEIVKPATNSAIRWTALLDNPFIHPTVMMRKSVLMDYGLRYKAELIPTEDYALWIEILKVSEGRNLEEKLLDYRCHPTQISQEKRGRQLALQDSISLRTIREWIPVVDLSVEEVELFRRWIQGETWGGLTGRAGRGALLERYFELFVQVRSSHPDLDWGPVRKLVVDLIRRDVRRGGYRSLPLFMAFRIWKFLNQGERS